MTEQNHSSRYRFAKATGDKVICCFFNCEEPATIDVPAANSYFCEDHYLANIVRFGCDLKGVAIEDE